MKVLFALILLCTLSFGQTHVVLPPNGGNIAPYAIVDGQQVDLKLNIPFTFPAAPPGTTSVTIAYHRNPLVVWGVEWRSEGPFPSSAWSDFTCIDNWTFDRKWKHYCQGDWISGYWDEAGLWVDHSDVPDGESMKLIQGSGISFHYGAQITNLAPFDGTVDWSGPSGVYGTNVGAHWTAFTTDQVAQFQRADENGNVTINFAPRGGHWLYPFNWTGHWYADLWAWVCCYNIRMGAVTIQYQ